MKVWVYTTTESPWYLTLLFLSTLFDFFYPFILIFEACNSAGNITYLSPIWTDVNRIWKTITVKQAGKIWMNRYNRIRERERLRGEGVTIFDLHFYHFGRVKELNKIWTRFVL